MVVIVDDESRKQEIRSALLDGVADEIKDIGPPADFRASIRLRRHSGLQLEVVHTHQDQGKFARVYFFDEPRTITVRGHYRIQGDRVLLVDTIEGWAECPYSDRFADEVAKRVTEDILSSVEQLCRLNV